MNHIYNKEVDGGGNYTSGGKYLGSVGFWEIASKDSDTQITLTDFDGEAYTTSTLYYSVLRMISFTTKKDWGIGDVTFDAGGTGRRFFYTSSKDCLRWDGLKFYNNFDYSTYDCEENPGGAAIAGGGAFRNHTVKNCVFEKVYMAYGSVRDPYVVFADNTINDWGWVNVAVEAHALIENNTIDNGSSGFNGFMHQSVIRYNKITNANRTICGAHDNAVMPIGGDIANGIPNMYGWIYGNYILNTTEGIQFTWTDGGTYGWTVHNNVLIGCYGLSSDKTSNGIEGKGDKAIQVYASPYTKIYNNTILGINDPDNVTYGWLYAIRISNGRNLNGIASDHCTVKNNIIYTANPTHMQVRVGEDASYNDTSAEGFVAENNYYYRSNGSFNTFSIDGIAKTFTEWQATGYDNAGYSSATTDPKLVDVVGFLDGDFNLSLQSSSPCINSGVTISVIPALDINKISRPQGALWDIGAYEYVSGEADTTPPTASISINSNDPTNSTTTTLNISATDTSTVTEMKISNTNDFSSAATIAYTTIKEWILTTGDGLKTVYAWFKDSLGNWTNESNPVTDTITLDETMPIISNITISNITTNSAIINFTTNENTTSYIEYGLTTSYGSQTETNTTGIMN